MNLNNEQINYFIFKKLVKRKEKDAILAECEKLNVSVKDYLLAKEIITETTALDAMAEYYSMPFVEIDMLDIDKDIFDLFSFDFMKKHKVIPVCYDKNGTLIIATGKPLNMSARSAIASQISCKYDYILVPSVQIDRYVDSVSAVLSTSLALSDLNSEKTDKQIQEIQEGKVEKSLSKEDEVINNPSVRLVDSIIKEAIPYRASDIHIEPFEKNVKVRYRIDGDLQNRAEFPIEAYSAICARLKLFRD